MKKTGSDGFNHRLAQLRPDGFNALRIWALPATKKKCSRLKIKCGCCDEQVVIYHDELDLEINGVIGSIRNWREVLLPLLLIETRDHPAIPVKRRTKASLIPAVTPGAILQHEFLEPLGLSAADLAAACALPLRQVKAILAGRQAISGDIAHRLGQCLGISPAFWINLQHHCDLEVIKRADLRHYKNLKVLNPRARK